MKRNEGVITLEACIFVLFFMIIMIVMMSLYIMLCAHTMTAHVMLQTAESLSLDAYSIGRITDKTTARQPIHINDVGESATIWIYRLLGNPDLDLEKHDYFVSETKWYEAFTEEGYDEDAWLSGEKDPDTVGGRTGSNIEIVVRKRFIGYLTGGDEPEADKLLKSVYVVDGLNGLDFSKSYVQNGDLHVVLHYKLHYMMGEHVIPAVDIEQKSVAKLWK